MSGCRAAVGTTGSPEHKLMPCVFPFGQHHGSLPKQTPGQSMGWTRSRETALELSIRLASHQKPAWQSNQEHPQHSPNPHGQWLQGSTRESLFTKAGLLAFFLSAIANTVSSL